jgi:uncharacterized protein
MIVEKDQTWTSSDQNEFRVITVVDVEDNTWVHYINTKTGQEHSCYQESFESRFRPILNRN